MVDPAEFESPDDCAASWCADEDWCAVTCTMDVIGNKWHPVVVLLLLREGPLGFSALEDRMADVTGKVLTETLEALVEDGVVARREVSERPRRVEYSLTPAGAALEPVVAAMAEWGDRYLSDGFGADAVGGSGAPDPGREEPVDGDAPPGAGGRHAAAGPRHERDE